MSLRGRYSPVETRPPCGTYAAFFFALREKTANREHCGPCEACRQAKRDYEKARYPKHKQRQQENFHRAAYGIALDEKQAILAWQDGCCAICRSDTPAGASGWCTEHNHVTGEVRGVTCGHCNHLIGIAASVAGSESPEAMSTVLASAYIDYLVHGAARVRAILEAKRKAADVGGVQ